MTETLIPILESYGYWGMFVAAFVAGSFFPWSSEAIMLSLYAAGLHPLPLVVYASAGNILGSMFNYWVGSLGRTDWIHRYLHVSEPSLDKARRFMRGRGAWMGFFAFLPLIGSAITILLGLMRANLLVTLLSISIGKVLRYALLMFSVDKVFS